MKAKTLFLAATALSISFAACDKSGDDPVIPGTATEEYIDASSKTTWYYYSFATGEVVGSADESEANNAAWAARTDWDIAVQRYNIRTNGGASTTKGAQGGVYIFDADNADAYGNIDVKTAFASVLNVPVVEFATDKTFTLATMDGGTETVVRSEAVVVQMWKNASGTVMPPDYRPAPVCIFRTADGKNYYKVHFTQYKNEEDAAGHVKFNAAQIYQ